MHILIHMHAYKCLFRTSFDLNYSVDDSSHCCGPPKPRMDQYFNQMEKIIKERKTSSRIRFMLQDVLDLRRVKHKHSTNAHMHS